MGDTTPDPNTVEKFVGGAAPSLEFEEASPALRVPIVHPVALVPQILHRLSTPTTRLVTMPALDLLLPTIKEMLNRRMLNQRRSGLLAVLNLLRRSGLSASPRPPDAPL